MSLLGSNVRPCGISQLAEAFGYMVECDTEYSADPAASDLPPKRTLTRPSASVRNVIRGGANLIWDGCMV